MKVYIGIKTSDEAESIVTRATDFKIYHKLSEVYGIDEYGSLATVSIFRGATLARCAPTSRSTLCTVAPETRPGIR